tara:strand:+ start:1150 stop:3282 length:2133 start_codon:yes stop_codon:yes gene_type:complete
MMDSYSVVFFSLLFISSIIVVSSFESSFADEVIATSTGFEDSTILELKNSRGNTVDIDSVRIWLGEENDFKSFKTEQGWLGKKQLNGVIEFTSQNKVNPGESVKFGIKTIEPNPVINWKALDSNGDVISLAATKVTITKTDSDETVLNKPELVAIKDDSVFRLIPEQPNVNSDFRVLGENFIPQQNIDFYIQDDFVDTFRIDNDGKILFTSKIPSELKNDRTEFILRDSGGNEKLLSLRISDTENRSFSEIIKLSLGNTPKDVKLGQSIILTGMSTPNTTITLTSKDPTGNILNIDTVSVGSDGKWSYDNLFPPDLELGTISIEVDNGSNTLLRNFNVISPRLINVDSEFTMYMPGDNVSFTGKAIPNKEMSIILEDSIGTQVFSRSIMIGDSGNVSFDIDISRDSLEGTFVLYLYQGNEEGITTFGIGQEPEAILILKPLKLNFAVNEDVEILIQGVPNAQVRLILVDSGNREILSDSINLGADAIEKYKIEQSKLTSGSYVLSAQRGESVSEVRFSIGFTTGSGVIKVQTTKTEYMQGDQILILGNTGSPNSLLEIKILDPNGEVIKKVDTFSDQLGVFKIDNFKIPIDAKVGIWKIDAKSGSNFDSINFEVKGDENIMTVTTDKTVYSLTETMIIQGTGGSGGMISLKIFDLDGNEIDCSTCELSIPGTADGGFQVTWVIPIDLVSGEYEIYADDGIKNASVKFVVS